ncbi:MAG TPA: hypothetical protein VK667_02480, partial [Ktedonobacteraceae bacterium]|nr:hypothetical protein [Ktedonobacteraceae bacterium]
ELAKVQRKREWPTRIVQGFQHIIQQMVLASVLKSDKALTIPPFVPFLLRLPLVRALPAQLVAFGPSRVHVKDV